MNFDRHSTQRDCDIPCMIKQSFKKINRKTKYGVSGFP